MKKVMVLLEVLIEDYYDEREVGREVADLANRFTSYEVRPAGLVKEIPNKGEGRKG